MAPGGAFEVLFQSGTASPRCRLEEEYGTALLIAGGAVAANFVATIDGITSFGRAADDSRAVGGGVLADRTLMAMLRAIAGVIVVGAGTLRATLNHQWTPQALVPERAADLRALRAAAGLPAAPAPLLVVSGSGDIPGDAVAVAHPAVPVHVVTATGVVPALDALGAATRPHADVGAAAIVAAASSLGGAPILCEGGPHLLGTLLRDGVPVELFLTVAPQLAGRSAATPERRGLVEGLALAPFSRAGPLRSVRRSGDHLLLRYRIDCRPDGDAEGGRT